MNESRFYEWFIQHESDCEEAREDINNRFDDLLVRLDLEDDDEKVQLLREFVNGNYEP